MSDPDIELMLRFQKGDSRAFEEIIKKYQYSVINTIYRYTGDRTEAEDLAQEIFLRIYNARRAYRPTGKFSSWLFAIVNNICLNWIRYVKRHKTVSIFTDKESPQVNIARDQKTASSQLRGLELKITVRNALNTLPSTQRMAVILNKYEGLAYEEIAEVMGISVAAVKSLLSRGRENLKEKLKDYIK